MISPDLASTDFDSFSSLPSTEQNKMTDHFKYLQQKLVHLQRGAIPIDDRIMDENPSAVEVFCIPMQTMSHFGYSQIQNDSSRPPVPLGSIILVNKLPSSGCISYKSDNHVNSVQD